ncbi:class III lanthipeptide [Staphylococcus simulans]|nr:class III lanthipeptide [Staphylococcus simulans]
MSTQKNNVLALQSLRNAKEDDSSKQSNISIACKKKSSISAFSCVFQ